MEEPQENLKKKEDIKMPEEKSENKYSLLELREDRKSRVRVVITYGAAIFLFGGGSLFILYLIFKGMDREALALFNTLLPIASGFVAFWFAGRGVVKNLKQDDEEN